MKAVEIDVNINPYSDLGYAYTAVLEAVNSPEWKTTTWILGFLVGAADLAAFAEDRDRKLRIEENRRAWGC